MFAVRSCWHNQHPLVVDYSDRRQCAGKSHDKAWLLDLNYATTYASSIGRM